MSFLLDTFCIISLLACLTQASLAKGFTVGGYIPAPFQEPSPNIISSQVLPLTRKPGSKSAAYLRNIQLNRKADGLYQYGVTDLTEEFEGEEYITGISFGTESFQVIVDTGSSDTWLAETGFACVNITTGASLTEADCYFGPTYNMTSTFKQIPDENFNITYGDILL